MKYILLSIFILNVVANGVSAQAKFQNQYISAVDSTHENAKMLIGIIDKSDLQNDTSFQWYTESQKIYQHPDTAAVTAFKNNKDKIYFIIFAGTWCKDSHFIVPKFFKIQEVSGFPEDHITFFAVDRNKNTTGNMAKAFHIKSTPTIVVMEDGKELGRLIEYGESGYWDKELTTIINQK